MTQHIFLWRITWFVIWLILGLAMFGLHGCAPLAQLAPSLRYCDSVKYERNGRDIDVTAHCFEAVEPMVPLPIIK